MQYEFVDVVALVKREAKSEATPDEVEWLHRPENVTVWKEALASAISDVCDQFALQKQRLDRLRDECNLGVVTIDFYRGEADRYEEWKKKASRYRLGLEHRLREVRSRERTRNVMATDAARTVLYLLAAIEDHRAALTANGETRPEDEQLWACLEASV